MHPCALGFQTGLAVFVILFSSCIQIPEYNQHAKNRRFPEGSINAILCVKDSTKAWVNQCVSFYNVTIYVFMLKKQLLIHKIYLYGDNSWRSLPLLPLLTLKGQSGEMSLLKWQKRHPAPSFRPKRSGVEKSHSLMVHRTLGLEISRLRISIAPGTLCPIPACSPARDDHGGGLHIIIWQ